MAKQYMSGLESKEMNIRIKTEIQEAPDIKQMEQNILPTEFKDETITVRNSEGKQTFYCSTCYTDLSSLATKISHENGVKHLKMVQSARQQALEKGEYFAEPIQAVPNPLPTKIKVPVRIHKHIKETKYPVVGLEHITEYMTENDPEMDPFYVCRLCDGCKGIANSMFNHIMGHKHRRKVIEHVHPGDQRYQDLTQKDCHDWAISHAENEMELSRLIVKVRSDEEYPWPPGKAPWSAEKGGAGVAPNNAKENYGWTKLKIDLIKPADSMRGIGELETSMSKDEAVRIIAQAQAKIVDVVRLFSASSQMKVKMLNAAVLADILKEANLTNSSTLNEKEPDTDSYGGSRSPPSKKKRTSS